MSGLSFFKKRPVRSQLNGITELINALMRIFLGADSDEYCVVPGKRKPGYCNEKVTISASCASSANARESLSLKVASPPRRGCAGPMMIMVLWLVGFMVG